MSIMAQLHLQIQRLQIQAQIFLQITQLLLNLHKIILRLVDPKSHQSKLVWLVRATFFCQLTRLSALN